MLKELKIGVIYRYDNKLHNQSNYYKISEIKNIVCKIEILDYTIGFRFLTQSVSHKDNLLACSRELNRSERLLAI